MNIEKSTFRRFHCLKDRSLLRVLGKLKTKFSKILFFTAMIFGWFVNGMHQESASTYPRDVRTAFTNPKTTAICSCTDFEESRKVENKNFQNLIFDRNDICVVCR